MDIDKAKERKQQVEREIYRILYDFRKESGLVVTGIRLNEKSLCMSGDEITIVNSVVIDTELRKGAGSRPYNRQVRDRCGSHLLSCAV